MGKTTWYSICALGSLPTILGCGSGLIAWFWPALLALTIGYDVARVRDYIQVIKAGKAGCADTKHIRLFASTREEAEEWLHDMHMDALRWHEMRLAQRRAEIQDGR